MRVVSTATWTSAEPVSPSERAYSVMICCFSSLVIVMRSASLPAGTRGAPRRARARSAEHGVAGRGDERRQQTSPEPALWRHADLGDGRGGAGNRQVRPHEVAQ